MRKILAVFVGMVFLGVAAVATLVLIVTSDLPQMITVNDYKPLMVSEVFDRDGKKVGEFFRQKRILVPYEQIPEKLVQAFVSAEDSQFFEHQGLNYIAIVRAFFANLRAGRKVQGGSTITQQVARSLLLSAEKTYTRKIKEAVLAHRMETHLSKKDILYLYLNQIYLGQNAYGVGAAAQIYYRKDVKDLTVAEAAILAGLPQAPSRYSPLSNPQAAKERQRYVLKRMAEEKYISHQDAERFAAEPVKFFVWQDYKEFAPYYLETIRQMLVKKIGEDAVLNEGIKIYTGLDLAKQEKAQEEVQEGLRALDKRQGFRGPIDNLSSPESVATFLLKTRNEYMDEASPERILRPDGSYEPKGPLNLAGKNEKGEPLPSIPPYLKAGKIVKAVVTKVDDKWGLVYMRFAESKGIIDIETMKWARTPDPNIRSDAAEIKKPSQALKTGDIVEARITGPRFGSSRLGKDIQELKKAQKKAYQRPADLPEFDGFAQMELEQEPLTEGALIAFDQKTSDVISMVGGYDYERTKLNRAIQARRQTGSAFKALVYAAALDKNYTPATPIMDAPLVYEETDKEEEGQSAQQLETKTWKPKNNSQKFGGDVLFRNALIRSLNVPTVKIIENLGVSWAEKYARRLGIFSPLNRDFTLALGSSGVTLYEMTRAFAILGKLGQFVKPVLVHKVVDQQGKTLIENMLLDERFADELKPFEEEFEQRRAEVLKLDGGGAGNANWNADKTDKPVEAKPESERKSAGFNGKEPMLYFSDPLQVVRPSTAFTITSILQGVIDEAGGTGGAARSLGRPVAGKTGSTNGYFDAWFVGFTPDIATGVWVGYDQEKSLGRGEVGGRAALPIWLEYMKFAHEGLPARNFAVPDGVVFVNIDNETGQPASASTKAVVRQAFIEGTEPQITETPQGPTDNQDFYKEDLSQ